MKSSFYLLIVIVSLLNFKNIQAEAYIETLAEVAGWDGLSLDNNGNLYSASYLQGTIHKIDANKQVTVYLPSNSGGSAGMRFDDDGVMYAAMFNDNLILKVHPDGSTENFVTQVREPIGLDWDSLGNLYVSSFNGNPTVTKILPGGTKIPLVHIPELKNVSSVSLDSEDNVYVASYNTGDIYKVTQDGNYSLFAPTSAPGFGFVQYDDANNKFYGSGVQSNQILEIDIFGNDQVIIQTLSGGVQDGPVDIATMDEANGIAISEDGKNVFFATRTHVRRLFFADPTVDPIPPYFTSKPSESVEEGDSYSYTFVARDPNDDALTYSVEGLPGWLTFDEIDTLSGTPTSSDSNRLYKLTVIASDGTNETTQNFEIFVLAKDIKPRSGGGSNSPVIFLIALTGLLLRKLSAN